VKEDFNIEQLFQEKFNSFESDVAPEAWSNIQQSMQAGGAGGGSGAGMSTWVKGLIIGSGMGAAVVGGVYFLSDDETIATDQPQEIVSNDSNNQLNEADTYVPDFAEESNENHTNQSNPNSVLDEESDINAEDENQGADLTDDNDQNDDGLNGSDLIGNDNDSNTADPTTGPDGDSSDNNDDSGDDPSSRLGSGDSGVTGDDGPLRQEPIAGPTAELTFEKGTDENYSNYTFNANAENAKSVTWDFGDGKTATGENVSHTYGEPGVYMLIMTVRGNGGQLISENHQIEVQATSNIGIIPNIFTPNHDGRNDEFLIQSTEIEKFAIIIRNDKGQVVFDSNDPNFVWDGRDKMNDMVPSGNYHYQIIAVGKDGKEFNEAGLLRIETE
jgi:gliding motility-associated-like protein